MATFATWDSAFKHASITLSGGNLVATTGSAGGAWQNVGTTIGKSTGKWYWEITPTSIGASGVYIGIAIATAPTNTIFGSAGQMYLYGSNGKKGTQATGEVAYGSPYVNGAVLGFALDADNETIECFENNVSQGVMFSSLANVAFYAFPSGNESGCVFTANFGASALTYAPPSGYNAGLYTGTIDSTHFLSSLGVGL